MKQFNALYYDADYGHTYNTMIHADNEFDAEDQFSKSFDNCVLIKMTEVDV